MIDGEPSLKLPNGCTLRPGGRVRIPARQIWDIDPADIERYGLRLGRAYSFASEVIEWPLEAEQS